MEEYSDIARNTATCYVHFDRSGTLVSPTLKNKSLPPIMPKQPERCLITTVRLIYC
jgi:hypothetical protein